MNNVSCLLTSVIDDNGLDVTNSSVLTVYYRWSNNTIQPKDNLESDLAHIEEYQLITPVLAHRGELLCIKYSYINS